MRNIKCNITENKYNEMKNMNHRTLWEYCNNLETTPLDTTILWGYGLYGVGKVEEENGNYTLEVTIGNTCD